MAPESKAPLAWSLVVPVKVLAQAKSRLTALPDERRSRLALAMAADTIAAAIRADVVAVVLLVTDDPEVGDAAGDLGAIVLADEPAAGLNEALGHGAAYSRGRWPDRGVAGLAGDLPALRAEEVTTALTAAAELRVAFVPDAGGTGTTMYAAAPGAQFRPRFGTLSRNRHLADGAAEIAAGRQLAGLRRDVDTVDDLRQAAELGLGPRTRAVLAADAEILS
ncbi:MAG TPA: 2-phospho-L-lactate guanylyltransferase [Streptosporangiaceae bacterium]